MSLAIRAMLCSTLATLAAALMFGAPARAAVSCEQVFAIAQTAVRYRDQGYSLDQVLGALKDVDPQSKLSAAELEILRKAVTATYLGSATSEEVALECVQVRGSSKP